MSKIKDLTLGGWKLLNEYPPHVKGIRIQTNSQHTERIGEGYVGKIVFGKNLAVAR
ncbi:MAG: hypothetical protein Q8M34_03265 [Thermodesulfovibrionales bacterium]|nr:hypothetical protein [Thermodesulfovibrionales bacterium]